MSRILFEDARAAPGIFDWNGPISRDAIEASTRRRGASYASLEAWYLDELRAEYAERYGLRSLPDDRQRT